MSPRHNVHATGLVLDGHGIILRGASGSGKSLLALALLDAWAARGLEARLVADDRIDIEATPQGLVMHAPPTIAGLIELRGRGIVSRPHLAEAPVHLVVDFVDSLARMVEESELKTELLGVTLARAPVAKAEAGGLEHARLLVAEALHALGEVKSPARQKST